MLEGIGEPLRELREAVTDLRYRGRHEQLTGELQLLEATLELGLRYGALDEIEAAAIVRERLAPILHFLLPEPERAPARLSRRGARRLATRW